MCGWPDLVGAELRKSFSETLQGKFDTQGPPVWLSEDHTAFFSVHKQLLHTCIDWKLALTAIDVTEPERQPNQLFFIDMQNQSRWRQDAEGRGYRSDKRLVLRWGATETLSKRLPLFHHRIFWNRTYRLGPPSLSVRQA